MNPFSLTDIMRVSIIRAAMLQESGITTTIGTQATSMPTSNPGGALTQALVGEAVQGSAQQSSGVEGGYRHAQEPGDVDGVAGGMGSEADAASDGSGTGGGAGTGGTGGTGGGCFPTGTLISVLGGETPLEKAVSGVYLEGCGTVLSRIDHASRDWDLLVLNFDGGELRITPEHKIFCQRFLDFIPAENLREGDELRMRDKWTTIRKITRATYNGPVYNLLTSNGTFFVNGVLVHNMKL